MVSPSQAQSQRRRVPAAQRRDALIESAVHEFAHGGLHGTPVDRIARRVGVAQPYVFALFGSKRELFLAAVERGFELTAETFTRAAEQFDPRTAEPGTDVLLAMGRAYVELLATRRDYLMLQHQAYAACDDPVIAARVRHAFAGLLAHIERLSGAEPERIDEFVRYGMWLNVAAAMGVEDLSVACDWIRREQRQLRAPIRRGRARAGSPSAVPPRRGRRPGASGRDAPGPNAPGSRP
jgi:AcrR family transcriptional regulator